MKFINYLVLLFLLVVMQQSAVVAAASFVSDSARTVEQTSYHHESAEKAGKHTCHHLCYKTQCHCAANSCHATGLIFAANMAKRPNQIRIQSDFSYHVVIPQRIPASLFRPPIFS